LFSLLCEAMLPHIDELHIFFFSKSYTGIITVRNDCTHDEKLGCEWTITNDLLSKIFQERINFTPYTSYSFRVEKSSNVSLWIKPGKISDML